MEVPHCVRRSPRAMAPEERAQGNARFLCDVAELTATSLTRSLLANRLVQAAIGHFSDACALHLLDGDDTLALRATAQRRDHGHSDVGSMLTHEGVLRETMRSGQPLVGREERASDSLLEKSAARLLNATGMRSLIVVPVALGSACVGTLTFLERSADHPYDFRDLDFARAAGRQVGIALENVSLREMARQQLVQQATLPCNLADIPGTIVSAAYLPAAQEEQVGGDWYDAFSLDDNRVLLTIGDVTGHGLEASFIMGKLRHALNVVAMYESDPSRVLDVAERIVLRRYPEAVATAFVAVIDCAAKTVSYANAGHPPPMLRMRDGSIRLLAADGLPVGLRHLAGSEARESDTLQDVDLMFFYTDGLTEASRDAIEGERVVTDSLAQKAAVLVADAADFVKTLSMSGPAFDDIALLSLNFVEMDRWRFASDDQIAAQAARREFREKLRRRGVSLDECGTAELIFGELAANVARHAPGPVEVALEWIDAQPVLHLIDRGTGYAVVQLEGADVLSEQGRGLWLVQCLGGELEVEVLPRFGAHTSVILPVESARIRLEEPLPA